MKVLVLVASLVAAALARPDVSHLSGSGYHYKHPSNSYGVPSGSVVGDAGHYHQVGVPSGSYLPGTQQLPHTHGHVDFLGGSNVAQLIQDQKHVYYYASPDQEEYTRLRINIIPSRQKNTDVIFVKAPHSAIPIPEVVAPPSEIEDKTKVFVLVQKHEHPAAINIPAPAPVKTGKPEVYVVKYKDQHEAERVIAGGLQGEHLGSNVHSVQDKPTFIKVLEGDSNAHFPHNDKYSGFDGTLNVYARKEIEKVPLLHSSHETSIGISPDGSFGSSFGSHGSSSDGSFGSSLGSHGISSDGSFGSSLRSIGSSSDDSLGSSLGSHGSSSDGSFGGSLSSIGSSSDGSLGSSLGSHGSSSDGSFGSSLSSHGSSSDGSFGGSLSSIGSSSDGSLGSSLSSLGSSSDGSFGGSLSSSGSNSDSSLGVSGSGGLGGSSGSSYKSSSFEVSLSSSKDKDGFGSSLDSSKTGSDVHSGSSLSSSVTGSSYKSDDSDSLFSKYGPPGESGPY